MSISVFNVCFSPNFAHNLYSFRVTLESMQYEFSFFVFFLHIDIKIKFWTDFDEGI
jgi:hypothetical protein